MRPTRLFYIAWTTPSEASGACLAIRRHLVERGDFETLVLTNEPFPAFRVGLELFGRPVWLQRLMRTRLRRLIRQIEMLFLGWIMLPRALRIGRHFNPDVVFTIPDNDVSWCALLVAKRLKRPLVTNFQDWWPHNQYWAETERPYAIVRWWLEKRFYRLYRECALAFCTSEGMRDFLGHHPNARVLLPCPGEPPAGIIMGLPPEPARALRIFYAGTLSGDYGNQILALAKALDGSQEIELVAYGPKPDWSGCDLAWAIQRGIYRGFLPASEIKSVLLSADAFLAVMSFSRRSAIMSRVSFTTKFLEYAQYQRPIIIWGPSTCQPAIVAKRLGAGMAIVQPEPAAVVAAIRSLRDHDRYRALADGAARASLTIFDPKAIHRVFEDGLADLITQEQLRRT